MRANMDPLNPMASTLDPAIAYIYERANSVKSQLRSSLTSAQRAEAEMSEEKRTKVARQASSRELAMHILHTPERLRYLVADGKIEEAKKEWEAPLKMLEKWKAEKVGGDDVQNCIDDGEAALRGDPPNEKSWVNIKSRK
jgi:vacuolar protein sorting-associated protein 51